MQNQLTIYAATQLIVPATTKPPPVEGEQDSASKIRVTTEPPRHNRQEIPNSLPLAKQIESKRMLYVKEVIF